MTHISIILVHYNNEADTNACLDSLLRLKMSSYFKFTVLIVDNGSKEQFGLRKQLSTKNFTVIRSEANLGFTGGNNLGIHSAIEKYNSEYVVLLNNDTVVDPSFLLEMYTMATSDIKVGLISPKIYFFPQREFHKQSYQKEAIGNILWYAGGSIDWQHLALFHRGVDEVDRGQFDNQTTSDFATGCCVLIRREVLEKVGGFDKRYFLYLEDVDLNLRAQKAGYSIGFCASAKVWHKNAGSSDGAGSSTHLYYQTRNRILFAFKHRTMGRLMTMGRLALQFLLKGSSVERTAILHAVTGRYGKQQLV